jgi:ATP-binding cassette subfamily B (MDR/TAP) protein 1
MAKESTSTAAADAVKGGEEDKENGKKDMAMAKVPFHGLFKYADSTDVMLMLVGMVGALGSGMSMVVMTIIFGQMIDAFGAATPDTIVHRVNKVQPLHKSLSASLQCHILLLYRGLGDA